MTKEKEPTEGGMAVDMFGHKEFNMGEAIKPVHEALMKNSALYRDAFELKIAWLLIRLQLAYVEGRIGQDWPKGTS